MSTVTFELDGSGDFTPAISATGWTSINWDWGDATSTTDDIAPTKNYAAAGQRTVTLTVLPDTALKQITVPSEPLLVALPTPTNTPNLERLTTSGSLNVVGTLSELSGLTSLYYIHMNSCSLITGNLSDISGLTAMKYLYLHGTGVTGTLASVAGFSLIEQLQVSGTAVTGNLSSINTLTALKRLWIYTTAITGDIINLIGATNLEILRAENSSVFGDLGVFANFHKTLQVYLNGCAFTAAQLNDILDIYTERNNYTAAAPVLRINTNAPLSGSYTPPPVNPDESNGNWLWNAGESRYHPLTGYAAIYALANDPNTEGFNVWTFLYDPQEGLDLSIPADITDPYNTAYSFAAVTTNPGANVLTFSATGLPDGISIDSGTGVISGTTSANDAVFAPEITVIDGFGGTDSEVFSWTVQPASFAVDLAAADVVLDAGAVAIDEVVEVVDCLLLLGQSNASSQATIADLDSLPGEDATAFAQARTNAFIYAQGQELPTAGPFAGSNGWQVLQPGTNSQQLSTAGVAADTFGVESRIADRYTEKTGRDLYLIKAYRGADATSVMTDVIGGTRVTSDPGKVDWNIASTGELYDQYVALFNAAKADLLAEQNKTLKIVGIAWVIGESDASNDVTASEYATAEGDMLSALSAAVGADADTMIISPYLSEAGSGFVTPEQAGAVNDGKDLAAATLPGYRAINTDTLTFKDGVHYDTASVLQLSDWIAFYLGVTLESADMVIEAGSVAMPSKDPIPTQSFLFFEVDQKYAA